MPGLQSFKDIAVSAIDQHSVVLERISTSIWNNPELNYEERHAHKILTDFLEQGGFHVQRKTPIETAFIARSDIRNGPKICVMCEYDALPGIGHACGHNLIAEAGIAAGLGIKAALESDPSLGGTVFVFGTPAEEGGGGKIKMIEQGSFDQVDLCMMVHPSVSEVDLEDEHFIAVDSFEVIYTGKASHASVSPWDGINALDAVVACYNNVSMLRQQVKPECRMHGVIRDGGAKPNIIPNRGSLEYYVRAPTIQGVNDLKKRVLACAEGAAIATGCSMEWKSTAPQYSNLRSNRTLRKLYMDNLVNTKYVFKRLGGGDFRGSTDAGNVSHIKPTIHPIYGIPTKGLNHTDMFTIAAGSAEAQLPTLEVAKAMAMTAIDVCYDAALLVKIKQEFEKQKSLS